ncbi:MAG: hypothetical protein HY516_03350 [Candidatus Aenigmarchaeota archaeon]|nr:hypothetical protein [Candidatus Aenigmarchaeota archaeon]
MKRIFPNPVFVGAAAGLASAIGLVYYASRAVSPGILGTLAITVIAVLFGIFIGLSSATLSILLNAKKFFGGSECNNCGNETPVNASFCPHCGKRPVYFKMIRL